MRRNAVGDIELAIFGSNTYTAELTEHNSGNIIKFENFIEKLPELLTDEQRKLEKNNQRFEDG